MRHIGKIVLLEYEQYKRITHYWNRKTIHNNKYDINNIINSLHEEKYLVNIYGKKNKEFKIVKSSHKIYIDKEEEFQLIGYVFWDVYLNKLYYNKYYTSMIAIKKSSFIKLNNVIVKKIYINLDEKYKDYIIG